MHRNNLRGQVSGKLVHIVIDMPSTIGKTKKKAQSQGLRLNPPKEEVLEETSDWHPT
jgi:hypothetical protein